MEEIQGMRETLRSITEREKNRREVEEERKKGLAEGEHYYILYWGYSDEGSGDRGWMGSIKAREIDECEEFVRNEILTEQGKKDIWSEDGDGEEWAIFLMSGEDEKEGEEEEDEGKTNYIEIRQEDHTKPDTSIFGDKTFWDLTG